MNCNHPFFGNEKFCPECGQKNKGKQITFGSFMHEIFNGFISWDSKFWTTLIPLLIKPGKISRDYIDGKRNRYSNPFQFYLTVSVIFFLLIGLTNNYEKFQSLKTGKKQESKNTTTQIDTEKRKELQDKEPSEINNALKEIDSSDLKNLTSASPQINLDSLKTQNNTPNKFQFGDGTSKIDRILKYQRKNPDTSIDTALDSLKIEKTFFNRFMYDRAEVGDMLFSKQENIQDFYKELISYISISLFVFLPLFTLFLKLFYIRRKYTYVEHLVFVFHTQTVFFLLLTVFYFINYFKDTDYIISIFLVLFLTYLFIAMRKFYRQKFIKTFIKFVLLNMVYMTFSVIGVLIVLAISFALY